MAWHFINYSLYFLIVANLSKLKILAEIFYLGEMHDIANSKKNMNHKK